MSILGQKGGQKTLDLYGKKYFSKIGKLGFQKRLKKFIHSNA